MVRRASPPRTKAEAEVIEGKGEVQQCTQCDGWYSRHSYPGACFACAVGMEPYAGGV